MSASMVLKFDSEDTALTGESMLVFPDAEGTDVTDGIDIESTNFGISCAPTIENGQMKGGGRPHLQDLSFTKKLDKVSVALMDYCLRGSFIGGASLYLLDNRDAGDSGADTFAPRVVLQYKLTQVYVSNHNIAFSGDYATESFVLTYGHIEITYNNTAPADGTQDAGNKVVAKWNLITNKPEDASAAGA